MEIFKIITPFIYWALIVIWLYIFVFYLRKFLSQKETDKFLKILLVILAIDAFRTLLESFYFGVWFTSLSELLPLSIYSYLSQPQIVFIPKLFNLIASILIFVIIIKRWLPEETQRIDRFNKELQSRKKELKESEEYNRLLFNTTTIGLALCRMDGELVDINPSFAELIGRTKEETLKLTYWDITPEKYGKQEKEQIRNIEETGSYGPYEKEYIHKDGHLIPVRLQGRIMEREGVKYIWSSVEDITKSKKNEEDLQLANVIINRSPAVAFRWQSEEGWPVEFVTDNVRLLTGFSADEFKNGQIQYSQLIHKDDLKRVTNEVNENKIGNKDKFTHLPYRIITLNKEVKWVNDITFMQRDTHGNIKHFEGIVTDITEQQLALKSLQESDERLELFFSQSLDGFFFMMLDEPIVWNNSIDKEKTLDYIFLHQRITKANKAVLDQYEVDEKEFIGRTPTDLFSHDIKQGRQVWKEFFDKGQLHIDTNEKTFKGKDIILEGDYICLYDSQKRIIGHFGIQRDITFARLASEDLKKHQTHLEELVKERTKELEFKNRTLEKINNAFAGRELRMAELKKEIEELKNGHVS